MNKAALDKFGELLVKRVRDKAIDEWEKIISGQMLGETAERARQRLARVDASHRSVLLSLVPLVVDTTLHHLLWTMEQEQDLDVQIKDDDGTSWSLRDISDGLTGELPSDEGWVFRYSQKAKDHLK
jgi:hypothetical protein